MSAADGRVHVDHQAGVCTLTLDRVSKRNALTAAMYAQLAESVAVAGDDPDIAVLRLRGAGDDFTAGHDLADLAALAQDSTDAPAHPVFAFLHGVVDCPKPLVAEVRGHALGVGTTLLLHCDVVIAASDATLGLPFVPLGLVPEFASTRLLPELLGPQRAARLALLGDRFPATEAERLGLVSQVCEDPAVAAVAGAWCRRLTALPREAMLDTRALLRPEDQRRRLHAAVDAEAEAFARRLASAEHCQAVASFRGEADPG